MSAMYLGGTGNPFRFFFQNHISVPLIAVGHYNWCLPPYPNVLPLKGQKACVTVPPVCLWDLERRGIEKEKEVRPVPLKFTLSLSI